MNNVNDKFKILCKIHRVERGETKARTIWTFAMAACDKGALNQEFFNFVPNSLLLGFSLLSWCVRLVWNAVSASPGLSPSLSPALFPMLSSSWSGMLSALLGLSPMLCPPPWVYFTACLQSCHIVSHFVSHFVFQLVWDAVSKFHARFLQLLGVYGGVTLGNLKSSLTWWSRKFSAKFTWPRAARAS